MICKDGMAEILPAVLINSSFDNMDFRCNGLPTGNFLQYLILSLPVNRKRGFVGSLPMCVRPQLL